jgi:hypothetical protein
VAKAGFPVKAEFLDLPGFEKAHDNADSFRVPTGDLAVEPLDAVPKMPDRSKFRRVITIYAVHNTVNSKVRMPTRCMLSAIWSVTL